MSEIQKKLEEQSHFKKVITKHINKLTINLHDQVVVIVNELESRGGLTAMEAATLHGQQNPVYQTRDLLMLLKNKDAEKIRIFLDVLADEQIGKKIWADYLEEEYKKCKQL